MAGKFYAVKKGKVPGIYTSWDACKSMVHGFPGAVYKGFATRAEAEQFLEEKKEEHNQMSTIIKRGTKGTGKLCVCRRFV